MLQVSQCSRPSLRESGNNPFIATGLPQRRRECYVRKSYLMVNEFSTYHIIKKVRSIISALWPNGKAFDYDPEDDALPRAKKIVGSAIKKLRVRIPSESFFFFF